MSPKAGASASDASPGPEAIAALITVAAASRASDGCCCRSATVPDTINARIDGAIASQSGAWRLAPPWRPKPSSVNQSALPGTRSRRVGGVGRARRGLDEHRASFLPRGLEVVEFRVAGAAHAAVDGDGAVQHAESVLADRLRERRREGAVAEEQGEGVVERAVMHRSLEQFVAPRRRKVGRRRAQRVVGADQRALDVEGGCAGVALGVAPRRERERLGQQRGQAGPEGFVERRAERGLESPARQQRRERLEFVHIVGGHEVASSDPPTIVHACCTISTSLSGGSAYTLFSSSELRTPKPHWVSSTSSRSIASLMSVMIPAKRAAS